MLSQQILSDRAIGYRGAKGTTIVTRLSPGYLLLTMAGRDEGDLAEANLAGCQDEIDRNGRVVVFADLRQLQSSGASAREKAEAWVKLHRSQLVAAHVLLKSKLM